MTRTFTGLEKSLIGKSEGVRDIQYFFNNGINLAEQGKHEEAIICFDEAIRLKPNFYKTWDNKGISLGKLGKSKDAIACFDEVIRLVPDHSAPWNNKGVALNGFKNMKNL